jgi:hypothetical protein
LDAQEVNWILALGLKNAIVVVAFCRLIQDWGFFEALFHKFSDAFFPVLTLHGVWELVV